MPSSEATAAVRIGARPPLRPGAALGRVLLLLVPGAYLAALLLAPLFAVVRAAFAHGPLAFAAAVSSPLALHAFAMTALTTAVAVVLNTAFGLAIAWVLVRDDFRGRRLLSGLVDLPFAVSPVMIGLMAMLLFGTGGWLLPATRALHLRVLFGWPAMALATTFVSLPLVVRELVPVLEEAGIAEEEAARTLGASRWQTLRHVVLPTVRWGLLYGVVLTTARCLGEFGAVLLVSGAMPGQTETATLLVYRLLEERRDAEAHAVAVVLATASVALLAAMKLVESRRNREHAAEGAA